MLKAAAQNGWLDERAACWKPCRIKRAGADAVLTYFALDAARWLADEMICQAALARSMNSVRAALDRPE
jgi:hypothetical protein